MKRIILLRHAEAASVPASGSDKDRELTDHGQQTAKALGGVLKDKFYVPDIVFCSSATRTRQTHENILEGAGIAGGVKTVYEDALYNADRIDLMNYIHDLDDKYATVAIVGHNPSIYQLAVVLSQNGSDHLMNKLMEGFKPGSLAVIECPCGEWNHFQPGQNRLIDILDPLDYAADPRPTRWM